MLSTELSSGVGDGVAGTAVGVAGTGVGAGLRVGEGVGVGGKVGVGVGSIETDGVATGATGAATGGADRTHPAARNATNGTATIGPIRFRRNAGVTTASTRHYPETCNGLVKQHGFTRLTADRAGPENPRSPGPPSKLCACVVDSGLGGS